MQYEWKIRQIEVVDKDDLYDVVVTVCFDLHAREGNLVGFVQGDVKLLPPDAESFTAFESLTEGQVVEWGKAALGESRAAFEDRAREQIESQKVPQPKAVSLPWDVA
jgi:hypothetical protein